MLELDQAKLASMFFYPLLCALHGKFPRIILQSPPLCHSVHALQPNLPFCYPCVGSRRAPKPDWAPPYSVCAFQDRCRCARQHNPVSRQFAPREFARSPVALSNHGDDLCAQQSQPGSPWRYTSASAAINVIV